MMMTTQETTYDLHDIMTLVYEADVIAEIPELDAVQYQVNIHEKAYVKVIAVFDFYIMEMVDLTVEDDDDADIEYSIDVEDIYNFIEYYLEFYEAKDNDQEEAFHSKPW